MLAAIRTVVAFGGEEREEKRCISTIINTKIDICVLIGLVWEYGKYYKQSETENTLP